jgi:hypothetical protein
VCVCCFTQDLTGAGTADSPSAPGRQVQRFSVTTEQERQFKMHPVKAMITSSISFNFAVNDYLTKALASLGMQPLGRKQVAGPFLDAIAAGEKTRSREAIAGIEYPPGASDGWRKSIVRMELG